MRIHVFLFRVRDGRRFPVRAFDQPNSRLEGHECRNVLCGPVETCLQADANVGKCRAGAPVQLQRDIHILAGFHVDPDGAFWIRILDDALQISVALRGAEVQSEVRQFDRNLALQTARENFIQ